MFVDKVKIKVKAGNGGDGRVSFHQEKFVANGGPNGGDGGRGGSVILKAAEDVSTLSDFYYKKFYRAEDGENGGIKNRAGKSGKDMSVRVPLGTVVKDAESGRLIADLFYAGDEKMIMQGGRGGQGNARFASSRRQAPRFAQKGEQTTEREIELELKTIADVGLVGFPNVGKSTFLAAVSAARPKIADYHFTTLSPNLGVVAYGDASWTVADIPGLIEGASTGAGLGHQFLRHIERVRLILHIVDISGSEGRDPFEDYLKITGELKSFSQLLYDLPQIIVLNKCDLLEPDSNAAAEFKKRLKAEFKKRKPSASASGANPDGGKSAGGAKAETPAIYEMSGATRAGIKELNAHIAEVLAGLPRPAPAEIEEFTWETGDPNAYDVIRLDENTFEVTGAITQKLSQNVVFDDYDSMNYFHKMLKSVGIIKKLYASGAKQGDTVIMLDLEFDFVD